ncbi:MAG TPA: DegQ family serine endoprotease [Candidatus Cybelea sp.]|nr:DegQ family serine endoprotease [Candidatus Cybelea sp.]
MNPSPQPGSAKSKVLRRAAFATTAIVALSLAMFGAGREFPARAEAPLPATAQNFAAPASFAPLVERVAPAVVNVSTTQKVDATAMSDDDAPQFPPGSPFNDLMKRFFQQQQRGSAPQKVTSLGSGFIIDPSGYVVTNNHVVGNASAIKVIMSDGKELPAKLVGRDAKTDLALLKVNAGHPLPYVEFGDSDKSKVGDWVVAVGNPFGLGGTVTAGIVSARGRNLNSGPFDDYLQVDAPINRGNSGGPLFDIQGRVIGINSAIISPNGGSVGVGFAIPATLAKPVIGALKTSGKVDRGWLGVQIQQVTPEIADNLGLDKPRGALVAAATPDAPAAKAGVRQGDVIVAYGGKAVDAMHDLPRLVAETHAGTAVDITVWRDGREVPLHATIAQMKDDQQQVASNEDSDSDASSHAYGLALAPLNEATRQRFDVPKEVRGVLIVGVQDGGPAAEQGLQPGDVIEKVGRDDVTSPSQVKGHLKQEAHNGKKSALLLVNRHGNSIYVALGLANS